jgi:hypothetical protein
MFARLRFLGICISPYIHRSYHRSIVHQYASPSFCCFAFQFCCVVPAYAIPYLHPSLRAYPILGFVRAEHLALFPQILGELIVLYIPLKNCPARTPIQNNSDLFTNVFISVNMHYQLTFGIWDQVWSKFPLTIYDTRRKISAGSHTCFLVLDAGSS